MSSRHRVLVLDPDPDLLIRLQQVLEDAGFDTTTTWNCGEAQQLLDQRQFDLVLIGDHPPEVRGGELLRCVQRRGVRSPCVIMHAGTRFPFDTEYLHSLGASGVVSRRPCEALPGRLRQWLDSQERREGCA